MRRTFFGRFFAPLLLTIGTLSCTLTTQPDPEIPMVTISNSFVAALSGVVTAAIDGPATFTPVSGPVPRTVELQSTADPTVRVVFLKGLLGSSTFDFAVGTYSLSGIPGFRPVDAIFYLSGAVGDDFYATSGSLEIVISEASIIRGRFDFRGTSISGTSTRQVRLRGTFWAVPETP